MFNKATKLLKQAEQDRILLKSFIIKNEPVHSTAERGAMCVYYYVKPGETNGITNIEFVQKVYAKYGINLKQHVSHLDKKETPVLYIKMAEISTLNKMQQDLLFDKKIFDKKPSMLQRLFGRSK